MLETAILDDARLDATQRELPALTDRMPKAIAEGDAEVYASLCSPQLSCYEDVCGHRIDGVGFHLHLLGITARRACHAARSDILTPRVQVYGETGTVTYTRLLTLDEESGPRWVTYNETRVFVRSAEGRQMVHFHRSRAGA